MTNKTEKMSVAFAIHDAPLDGNSFRGMASVFNTMIDAYIPTRILPGAFTKTLSENAKRIKVLYQHNPDWPIGLPTKMEEKGDGLLVEAKISDTTMGKDCLTLMRDKVITELSIGFDPIKFSMVEEAGADGAKTMVRLINECRLWEFSPVTFAANSKARISNVNSLSHALRSDADVVLTAEMQTMLHSMMTKLRQSPEAQAVDFLSLVTTALQEQHAGKVLSAKNKQLVSDALSALQALIDAAEPSTDDSQALTLTAMEERLSILNMLYHDTLRVRA